MSTQVADMDDSDNRWSIKPDKLVNESDYTQWQYLMTMNYKSNERAQQIFEKKIEIYENEDGVVSARKIGQNGNIGGAR